MKTFDKPSQTLFGYESIEKLEQYLGNPEDSASRLSFKKSVALDETEAFPEELLKILNDWGLHLYYIPTPLGGKLTWIDESFNLIRMIARRDLTVAIAHGNVFLGSAPLWIGASDNQKRHFVDFILAKKKIALALTEYQHGSDLTGNEVQAEQGEDGFVLKGEKWLFNNAFQSDAITLLARTDPQGGARGFSLLFLEKNEETARKMEYADKIHTMGVRGMDMGGIRFEEVLLPPEALINQKGTGLELIVKSLQITRAMCAAFSLGAFDTALRTVVKFASTRELYGGTIINMPIYKRKLAQVFTQLLSLDCLTMVSNRALHVLPAQFSIMSAVVKSFVPPLTEEAMHTMSGLLGARHYLRHEFNDGIFQKLLRDNATISLFDGNTFVNLQAILLQIKLLAFNHDKDWARREEEIIQNQEQIFRLEETLPPMNFQGLDVFSKGKDDLIFGLKTAKIHLESLKKEEPEITETLDQLIHYTEQIQNDIGELFLKIKEEKAQLGNTLTIPPDYYGHAERYCLYHVASACLNIWLHNRLFFTPFFRKPLWVQACLQMVMTRLGYAMDHLTPASEDELVQELVRLYQDRKLFSLRDIDIS